MVEVPEEEFDTRVGRGVAVLVLLAAAVALGLLPAAVGLTILLGTVPPEFGAGAGLAVLAGIKLGAVVSGIVAAARAARPLKPALGFD